MRVVLIAKDDISGLVLPDRVYGSFWLTDLDEYENQRNLINVEARDGKWILVSNNNVFCVQNDSYVPYVELKEYSFTLLKSVDYENGKKVEKNMFVYSSPSVEEYKSYDISRVESSGIKIGSGSNCTICYNNPSVLAEFANIIYSNGKYYFSCSGNAFINNKLVTGQRIITTGDVIFIMGLKIVLSIKDDSHMLMINNPLGSVTTMLNEVVESSNVIGKQEVFDEEDLYMPLYSENDYFHKKPRFETKIEEFVVSIDSPPEPGESKMQPLILTIAPMIMMGLTSLLTGYNAFNSYLSGNTTLLGALPSMLMAVSMLTSALILPVIMRKYNAKEKEKYLKERKEKYSKYVEEKRQEIQDEIVRQRTKLIDMYPSTKISQDTILNKMTRLWERRVGDDDFLTVNLGDGTQPMRIKINYPQEHFSMAEDELKEMAYIFGREPKNLVDVPIELSLVKNNKAAIIGKNEATNNLMKQLLLQIMAFHAYDELRIVMLTNSFNEDNWKFLKNTPYMWSNDKSFRYFGSSNDEYKEICYHLDAIYNSRVESKDSVIFKPYYLIITDSFKTIRNFEFIKKLLKEDRNLGFSLVILNERIANMPEQCRTFVNLLGDHGELVVTAANNKPIEFNLNSSTDFDYGMCAKVISNLPVEINDEKGGDLPTKVGFLEMYDVGRIEQLNCLNRWSRSNPILSLHAPIGVGSNGETIELDLHEKYHGPHGLIAGMTGSGKSEFLITYILSMAVNYHPYEVQFILIDYKGGGLAGAFKNSNYKLPHLVGTITNLDAAEINRSLASIESELMRREAAFNKAREISGESTIDIYKYQKLYRDHVVDEPISHLFIISDEFAELKTSQPEFMQQLIQTARIGRSLGVHLILATQKPSGVVDSQIWSNTRFRICLRVQEQSDSSEVIKKPDAAYLTQTGRFYFQVGYNEIFTLGQAAWAGGKYKPAEKINKEVDSDVDVINNIGYIVRAERTSHKKSVQASNGEELTNIVKYLANLAASNYLVDTQLWLERIPDVILVDDLIKKYNYNAGGAINPIIGEYDDPSRQSQNALTLPLSKNGNALVYGVAGSGKENFIGTMLYSLMSSYGPDDVNAYIIDCGAGSLRVYSGFPIVGDIIASENEEKIENLFKFVNTIIDERKTLFADYNGDYNSYCKLSGRKVPAIVVAINEYEAFAQLYDEYTEILVDLTRDAYKYGIYFVISVSTPNGVRLKLKQNFNQVFALQQNSDDDYSSILGNVRKNYPSANYGRGIVKWDKVYEFQTAMPIGRDNLQQFIREKTKEFAKKYPNRAPSVPVLPEVVAYKDIASVFGKSNRLVLGISKANLSACEFDFRKSVTTMVLAQDIEQTYFLIKPIISELLCLRENVYVIDCDTYELEDEYKKYTKYYDSNYEAAINELYDYVNDCYEKYKANNYNNSVLNNAVRKTLIIVSVGNMLSRLSSDAKSKFEELITNAKDLDILNVIIFDNNIVARKFELDGWYKSSVNSSEGIWVGNGIDDQFCIKVAKRTRDMKLDISDKYGFVVSRGKAELVKFLEVFNIKFK